VRLHDLLCPLAACFIASLACTDSPGLSDDSGAAGNSGPLGEYPRLDRAYSSDCQGYIQRLRDCGLLTNGPLQCTDPASRSEQCSFECLSIASCSILAEAECTGVIPVPLNSCFSNCTGFTCDSGETVPIAWRCDDQPDCEDGSDEERCQFECGSGEFLPEFYKCDFFADCADASDEVDCDGFECGSGELIAPSWRCDLEADCADASDEAMCDWFGCQGTGADIPTTWRCDGTEDCLDGSDEFDCAKLLCD
jgi:hypothetical protein